MALSVAASASAGIVHVPSAASVDVYVLLTSDLRHQTVIVPVKSAVSSNCAFRSVVSAETTFLSNLFRYWPFKILNSSIIYLLYYLRHTVMYRCTVPYVLPFSLIVSISVPWKKTASVTFALA